ncbi:MAG: hypothetical protein AB8B56_16160 [Crocinitomicaceae bacterium]
MRHILLFLISVMCFPSFGQEDVLIKPRPTVKKMNRHQIELSPASLWVSNSFFLGHRLNYRFRLKRSTLELETNGTMFRSLDVHANLLKEDKVFPLLNQSRFTFSKSIIGKGKVINRNKQKRFITSFRAGYHFFQHSTDHQDWDYWAYDSTAQFGVSSIRSFQSHSISAGLSFRTEKYKRLDGRMKRVASHDWSLDYLGCVYYQLSSYSTNAQNDYNIQNISNPYEVRKSGAHFKYRYTRDLNSNLGIHFGTEALYVPFIDDYTYDTSIALFVPRGGRILIPFFVNVNVGVSFYF